LLAFDQIFGLDIAAWQPELVEIPEHIVKLADDRAAARKDKNWQLADEIRANLLSEGYEVEDTRDGPRINKI
jgi:cysteinyl-tRNA synthetase